MAASLRPIARRALATQSDERLVLLVREGHEPAFDEIVRRYRSPLVAFAAAIAGADRAEDVVQAGLMRAHGALRADEREIRLRPWLFAIIRNGALNAVRDEPAWSELDPERQGGRETAATAEQREELERLVDAVCALPESQRQALVMREMEGVGHAEIAAKLRTSPTAVRGLIFRARTTLRNALGALVPLPVLRWLLEDTAAAAAAGAAGAGGAGAAGAGGGALMGGALGKAAIGLTAAVVAVGAGKAIQDRRSGDERPAAGPETASAATGTEHRSGKSGHGSATGTGPGEKRRQATREGAEERDERRGEAGDERGGDRSDGRGGGGGGGGEGGGSSGSSGSSSSGGGGGGNGGSGGHSGSSGGSDDDDDEVDDEIDDDDRFELEEPEEPDEPEELDDDGDGDHSGPGSGDGDDD